MDSDLRLLAMQRIQQFNATITQREPVDATLMNLQSAVRLELVARSLGVMHTADNYIVRIDTSQKWSLRNIQWGRLYQPKREPVHENIGLFSPTAQCDNCESFRTKTISTYFDGGTRSHKCLNCGTKFKTSMAELDAPETEKRQRKTRKPNKRSRYLEHAGERLTISQWAARKGINCITLFARINAGWSAERAIETPVQTRCRPVKRVVKYRGKSLSVKEWAEQRGMRSDTLEFRLRSGWSVKRALTTPVRAKRSKESSGEVEHGNAE